MRIFISALAGLVFGLGLIISGMSDPAKVKNFLDFFGTWDPSLAFVMGGAIAVTLVGYRIAFGRGKPLLADGFSLPRKGDIDAPLVIGAALFGIGTAALLVAVGLFPVAMIRGHGRRHQDRWAIAGDSWLGVIWLLFSWSVIGGAVDVGLLLGGHQHAGVARR